MVDKHCWRGQLNHFNDVQEPGSFHHKDQDNNDADDAVDGDNDTDHNDDDDMGALGWWCITLGGWAGVHRWIFRS